MMFRAVQRILGMLLMLFSVTMLPPIGVAWIYGDTTVIEFATGFGFTFAAGALLWFPVRKARQELRLRDGFVIVAMFWVVLGVFGAAPLVISEELNLSLTDAVFESMSDHRRGFGCAVRQRPSKPLPTAHPKPRRWSDVRSKTSRCQREPPSAPSCVAMK